MQHESYEAPPEWSLVVCALLAPALAACSEERAQSGAGGPETARDSSPGFRPQLVGLELSQDRVRPGDAFLCGLRFANRGETRAERDYRVFLHVESPEQACGKIAFQGDHEPDPPTSWWHPGELIDLGAQIIAVPPEQAEGVYAVHAGLFDLEDESRVLDSAPVRITVARDAALLEEWIPAALSESEARNRHGTLGARLIDRRSARTEYWELSVGVGRAAFELEDLRSGVLWTSTPLHDRLGMVHVRSGDDFRTVPIDHIDSVCEDGGGLRIATGIEVPGSDAELTLELLVDPVEGGTGLSLSWRAGREDGGIIDSVTLLDQAFWTSDIERGAVVLPQWLGELESAERALPSRREYYSNDISMQMAGVLKQGSALLFTWTDHGAVLTSHANIHDHPSIAGRAIRSVSLQLHREDPSVEIFPLGIGNYVDVARAYRPIAERRGYRATWSRKRSSDERVALMEGAPVFRLEGLVRIATGTLKDDHPDEDVECLHTFGEVASCARHWREELEIDRAQILLGGWNLHGYDSGHPDILPANPQCGGDEGLAECAASVRELGYLFGLHDNYQDIYPDSPSWDPELVGLDEEGEMRAGGLWAGGQSWMVCTSLQLGFARQNLPRVAELFRPDSYFLDTTLTTRLLSCTHPDHPMTPLQDREHRIELFNYARDTFGLVGLEGAREWAVPHAHFFEGLLTHRTVHGKAFTAVPIFPIVYGDCIDLLTMQGDRLDPWEAESFLDHLLYGEMPIYAVGPHRYWIDGGEEEMLAEEDARDPRFAFVRSDRGWGSGLCVTDRLIKNTWEVLSHLHRAIGDSPMTDHRFLREDRSAETSSFDDVRVTVNYSDEPLTVGEALLGRCGFVVESPRFVAFFALRFGGVDYPQGACFTMRSLDGEPLFESRRMRVFHAFGEPTVRLWDGLRDVEREAVLER